MAAATRASRRTSARSTTNIWARSSRRSMTRCIQCTRCIRFSEEVAGRRRDRHALPRRGQPDHLLSRAARSTSELAGNLADVCPVGALLQKPQMLRERGRGSCAEVPAIDVMDAVGIEHPPRRPPAPGDAHPAAHQRGRERGVDQRQDAPPRRRAGPQPARPAVGAREGQAARGELGRGARAVRRSG